MNGAWKSPGLNRDFARTILSALFREAKQSRKSRM
jgi:hypothetical protein